VGQFSVGVNKQLRFHPNGQVAEKQSFKQGIAEAEIQLFDNEGKTLGKDGKPVSKLKAWLQP
jgi:hypothetical protein